MTRTTTIQYFQMNIILLIIYVPEESSLFKQTIDSSWCGMGSHFEVSASLCSTVEAHHYPLVTRMEFYKYVG